VIDIDELLLSDAERWNADQPAPPDLDTALRAVTSGVSRHAPSGRRRAVALLAMCATIAAVAVAAVVLTAVRHDHRQAAPPAVAASSQRTPPSIPLTDTHTAAAGPTTPIVDTYTIDLTQTQAFSTFTGDLTPLAASAGSTTTANVFATSVTVQGSHAGSQSPHSTRNTLRGILAALGVLAVALAAWGLKRTRGRHRHQS
jgi:hypothetical protein